MNKLLYLACVAAMIYSAQASAQTANEEKPLPEPRLSVKVVNAIGRQAAINISDSEQVFCYNVEAKTPNYTGYTINGMALTGFCGTLKGDLRKIFIFLLLANEKNIDFTTTESCTISPRFLLRFVRGVDNTDVLVSSPCASASVFYGGNVKTLNLKAVAETLDGVSKQVDKYGKTFVSPALLNQLLPIGNVRNKVQKILVEKVGQPVKNWEDNTAKTAKGNSGWNNLNF